jgi:ribonuclease P protein component
LMVAPGELEWSRLGLVVSKKVGAANRRNLVKRRLREWFRHRRSLFRAPLDLVVIARPGAAGLSAEEVTLELETATKRWRPD